VTGGPLLVRLQRLIERTYDLDTGIADIAPYIIGDEGYERLYSDKPVLQKVGAAAMSAPATSPAMADQPTARTLLREEDGGLRVCIYYPDRLIENLEASDPSRRLGDHNVDDFATLVEELDHFLMVADRHRAGGELSLLELELHANVTKELTLRLFVARMRGEGRDGEADQAWVRHHLFGKGELREDDPEVRDRYRDAAALAVRYLDYLEELPPASRPSELRRFHRRTHHEKIAQIVRL
jgi:hypothetical protein